MHNEEDDDDFYLTYSFRFLIKHTYSAFADISLRKTGKFAFVTHIFLTFA